jgi:micrococcal nuclease
MRHWLVALALTATIAFLAAYAQSAEFRGRAKRVVDGDTVQIGASRCRMARIDAPEHDQPYGAEAKAALTSLLSHRNFRVVWSLEDRYGRKICDVYAGQQWINLEMVRRGAAWHYTDYDKSPEFDAAEQDAKERHLGLWAEPSACKPEDWRTRRAKCARP